MARKSRVKRRGRIDEFPDLAALDLLALNGGVNPWGGDLINHGFARGAAAYRSTIETLGFAGRGAVADLGSGWGLWSLFLAEVNTSVTGYESKSGGVELARKLAGMFGLDNVTFETARISRLPAADGAFDGVWLQNTLQVVDRGKVLAESRRVLRPGGLLFVGLYRGLGGVLRQFCHGYVRGGSEDASVRGAILSFRAGPLHDGVKSYASLEHLDEVLHRHGFRLDHDHPLDSELTGGGAKENPFFHALSDLPAFADRLESDPAFAAEVAAHPDAGQGLLDRVSFCAVKS
jgi:ubiquinone/menaquinone biosynthesis C-methylase UbiE